MDSRAYLCSPCPRRGIPYPWAQDADPTPRAYAARSCTGQSGRSDAPCPASQAQPIKALPDGWESAPTQGGIRLRGCQPLSSHFRACARPAIATRRRCGSGSSRTTRRPSDGGRGFLLSESSNYRAKEPHILTFFSQFAARNARKFGRDAKSPPVARCLPYPMRR